MKKIITLTVVLSFILTGAVLATDDGQPYIPAESDEMGTGNTGRDPGSLTTTFAGGNGYAGNMFDIVPTIDLVIDAIDVHVDAVGETVNIAVYVKDGTCVGFESNAAAWTLLGNYSGTGAGIGSPTLIDMSGNGKVFLGGQTYGIYVDLQNYATVTGNLNYTNGTPTAYTNADLNLTTHCGKGTPAFTGSTFLDRIWNGTIYYNTTGLDLPRVDITCNGDDAGVVVPSGADARIEFDIHAGLGAGRPADVWVVMQTPFGYFSYDTIGPHSGWNSGIANVYFSGWIYDLNDTVFDGVLPAGSYQAYTGLDKVANGVLDIGNIFTYDSVDFIVQ